MAPLRGWGPRGKRLEAQAPHGHWRTLTFIAALRHDRVSTPWVIDGPINGTIFRRYVECAPIDRQAYARGLPRCRACCSSNCTGLR
jgi:hypothetical protein